jgi:hypothetical protein
MIYAKQSPRFENNILYWYYKNTFSIDFTVACTIDGELYNLKNTDIVEVSFKETAESDITIIKFRFFEIEANKVTVYMEKAYSELFYPGEYFFGITLISDDITTVISEHRIIVEKAV